MNKSEWLYHNRSISPQKPPHVGLSDFDAIESGEMWRTFPKALRLSYISDWDCDEETDFWYIIKDTPFDIMSLKAKRRYEITKANKNFTVRLILSDDSIDELYDVYIESLRGYKNAIPMTESAFRILMNGVFHDDSTFFGGREMLLYGAYDNDGRLCGYAHLIKYKDCMLFSQLKTRPSAESKGVNAAICNKILVDSESDLSTGRFYISDGARNLYHETHFQDYLQKYFQFRRAYCRLNVIYPKRMKWIISLLFPFKNMFVKFDGISMIHAINAVLKSEEIARKCKRING